MTRTLQCCFTKCPNTVTHIGEKGWVYCASCAKDRQYWERCRRMRAWEIRRLEAGYPISYRQWTQLEAQQFDQKQFDQREAQA